MFVPDQEDLVARHDALQKMMASRQLRTELIWWIHARIDLPPDLFLRRADCGYHVAKTHVAHDEHVNVTLLSLFPLGDRAEDEGNLNSVGQRGQGGPQDVGQPRRLHQQTLQFGEDRALGIDLKVDLFASGRPTQDAARDELAKFPLNCAHPAAGSANNLPQVERLVGVP
jgi:hypothetical protein